MTDTAPSRRDFVCAGVTLVCALVSGCRSAPTDAGDPPSIEITDDAIMIPLDAVPGLDRAGGFVVVRTASVIVLNVGAGEFRAFSNVCTHAGCGIDRFERSRMICPCHGSEYDTNGVNVAGPAPGPLTPLPLELDAARRILRVERLPERGNRSHHERDDPI